jgi:hypothetical protein
MSAKKKRAMRTHLYLVLISGIISLGCGGTPKPNTSLDQQNFDGLMSAIKAKSQPQPGRALVTVAIFGGAELADSDGLVDALKPFLDDELGRIRHPKDKATRPMVTSARIDGNLPLDLPSLAAGSGQYGPAILRASHVAFIRYAARPLKEDRQIKVTLGAAAVLASSERHIVVDLSTRRAFDALSYANWVRGDSALNDQVVPGAESTKNGVTLFTRGMAKFGLPDIEIFEVPKATARGRFAGFQDVILSLRKAGYQTVGDTLGAITLLACKRVPEAIESECVRLP